MALAVLRDGLVSEGCSNLLKDFCGSLQGWHCTGTCPWVTRGLSCHCHAAETAQLKGSFVSKWVSPAPGAPSSFCYQYLMPSKAQSCLLHHSLSCPAPSGAALGVSRAKFLSRRSLAGKIREKTSPHLKVFSFSWLSCQRMRGVSGQEL